MSKMNKNLTVLNGEMQTSGLMAELKTAMRDELHKCRDSWARLLDVLCDCLKADEEWLVPVRDSEEDSEEELLDAQRDGLTLQGDPQRVKLTVGCEESDETVHCAFTDPDAAEHVREEVEWVRYGCRKSLEDFLNAENMDGLRLNPWADEAFTVNRKLAKWLMEHYMEPTERVDAEARKNGSWQPRQELDVNAILQEWQEGWQEDVCSEDWRLAHFQLLADGTLALVFQMDATVYSGKVDEMQTEAVASWFRVLVYDLNGDVPMLKAKYRFQLQYGEVVSVFVRNGMLQAAVRVIGGEDVTVLQLCPNDDDAQFPVGDAEQLVMRGDGCLLAGYDRSGDSSPVMLRLFDADGGELNTFRNSDALRCAACTVSADDDFWFHQFPSVWVTRMNAEE